MISGTLIFLAQLHLQLGLIGIDEFTERCKVAKWLDGELGIPDPRDSTTSEGGEEFEHDDPIDADDEKNAVYRMGKSDCGDDVLEFIWSQWVFTRQDPDPYPSTPHGHLHNANNRWPKLNPYVGRVFDAKHQESKTSRLKKKQLIALWSDQRFRDFCRTHIMWYAETFPLHVFSVAHPLRFPKPWR